MRRSTARRLVAIAILAAALTGAAVPAHAAVPLFADHWKVKLRSDTLPGNSGKKTTYYSFDRPRIFNFTAYRVRGIKRLPLKLSHGWLTTSYRVKKPCYSARYVYRIKATRVADMEGEPVASRAKVRYFNSWRNCHGDSFHSWYGGTAVRTSPPQKGPAVIIYDSPDGCDPTLVEHSADEDSSVFYDWDGTFSYLWTFSDGGSSTQASPTHRYPSPGNHSATVLIRSIEGNAAKSTVTVEIPEPLICN
jgi:hypothetical protein